MRLSSYELEAIKNTFKSIFNTGEIYLFGSRVKNDLKGGDIDLYIKTLDDNKVKKKIEFLVNLKNKIDEQKIDVVLSYDSNSEIEKEAIKNGLLLI